MAFPKREDFAKFLCNAGVNYHGNGLLSFMNSLRIKVHCYAGYRGEETPRSIFFDDREIVVDKIMDMWLAPDHRYFKILGSDKAVYIIRNDIDGCFWELTFFKDAGT